MRLLAVIAASTLILGCNAANHKISPRPLAKTAKFAIHVVTSTKDATSITKKDPNSGEEIYLAAPAVITSTDVASVHLAENAPSNPIQPGDVLLSVTLTPAGATRLATATTTPQNVKLAIVINDEIHSTPDVRSPLSSTFEISGYHLE